MLNKAAGIRSAFSIHWRRMFALMALPLIAGLLTACDGAPPPASANQGFVISYFGINRWEGSYRIQTPDGPTYAFCASPNGFKELSDAYVYNFLDPNDLRQLNGMPVFFRLVEGTHKIDTYSRRALLTAVNWFGNSGMRLSYLDPNTGGDIDPRIVHAALSLVIHEYLNAHYAVSPEGFRRLNVSELQAGVNFKIAQAGFSDPGNVYASHIVALANYIRGFSWAYANGGTFDGRNYFGLGDLPFNPVHVRPLKIEERLAGGIYEERQAGDTVQPGAVLRITGGAYATRISGQDIPLRNLPMRLFHTEGLEELSNTWQHTDDDGFIRWRVRIPADQSRVWNFDTWIWGAGVGNTSGTGGRNAYRLPGADNDQSSVYGMQDALKAYAKDGRAEKAVRTDGGPPPTTTTTQPFEPPVGS